MKRTLRDAFSEPTRQLQVRRRTKAAPQATPAEIPSPPIACPTPEPAFVSPDLFALYAALLAAQRKD